MTRSFAPSWAESEVLGNGTNRHLELFCWDLETTQGQFRVISKRTVYPKENSNLSRSRPQGQGAIGAMELDLMELRALGHSAGRPSLGLASS
jgi:hypothetical protein